MGKERLTFEDLVNGYSTPRRDHPNRKGFEFGFTSEENGRKCYRKENDSTYSLKSTHGTLYPNPHGCKGLRLNY